MEAASASGGELLRVDADVLRLTTQAILEHSGLPASDAGRAAEALVSADLRGVDTHGVSNMLPVYLNWLANGHAVADPRTEVTREAPATANIDGGFGLGVAIAPQAMVLAMEKAAKTGVGMVTVHNTRHLGMAAYHSMLALDRGMIGLCLSAVGPRVLPTFGREARLGTNPIAVAAPAGDQPPFVYDAATSVITSNEVRTSHRLGRELPAGTVADETGTPLPEPRVAPPTSDHTFLLPLGSSYETGSHKGYGLAATVEVLSSVLGAATTMMTLGNGTANHLLAAIDIEAFVDLTSFTEAMDQFLTTLLGTPAARGRDRVVYAGYPEWETEQQRRRTGIPLHPQVLEWFAHRCAEADIAPLEVSS